MGPCSLNVCHISSKQHVLMFGQWLLKRFTPTLNMAVLELQWFGIGY